MAHAATVRSLNACDALDSISDPIALLDPAGTVKWRSASLVRLDAASVLEPPASFFANAPRLLVTDPPDQLVRAVREVLCGRSQQAELECRYGVAAFRGAAQVRAVPIPLDESRGALIRIVHRACRDEAEALLRESEQRWRRLVDGSPDVVFITDADSRMIYANRALEEQTGYRLTDFQMRQAENRFLHPEDRARIAAFLRDFKASDRLYSDRIENRFITKRGEVLWASSVVSKTKYRGAPALQFVVHNVTAEHEAREESARRLRDAELALHDRDEFLAVAAHELKTPLTSLLGYVQLLSRSEGRGTLFHSALDVIGRQANKLGRLVERLLDITLLDAGGLRLVRQSTDVVALVRELARTWVGAEPGQIEVLATTPIVAEIDALRFEQVMTNLIDNALKFSPRGAPVEVAMRSIGGSLVEITVTDHGPGIPASSRDRIFDRFFRLDAEHREGFGIGLYVSRAIVTLHGGEISAESPPEGGARFRVILPTAPSASRSTSEVLH